MKPRTQYSVVIGLLIVIVGISLFTFSTRNQESTQTFPATINRDCAPWDGTAFTVSIPYDTGTMIEISIWKSPDIKLPVTFSLPDEAGSDGNAMVHPSVGLPQQLTGTVSFQSVGEEHPVEGEFNFTAKSGKHFRGKFIVEWGNQIIYCG